MYLKKAVKHNKADYKILCDACFHFRKIHRKGYMHMLIEIVLIF